MTLVVLDGPMGTELAARSVPTPAPGWSAYALVTHPDVVADIHTQYARAGALVHRTNTFRVQHRLFPDELDALCRRAVELVRGAASDACVAGSLAPVEDCYRPDLAPSAEIARREHRTNATALARAGADLLVCETFANVAEAIVAVEEARLTGLPVWLALTGGPKGELLSPEAMEAAARAAVSAGATAVLANCIAAELTLEYVERLARVPIPFGAYANVYGSSAIDALRYAELARSWVAAGATIVGACCGAGPDTVAEIAKLLAER